MEYCTLVVGLREFRTVFDGRIDAVECLLDFSLTGVLFGAGDEVIGPLAAEAKPDPPDGGIGGLAALNLVTYQALDMLTMLGFVILIGIVVNNAILLVHQTLFHFRTENTTASEAIVRATRNRIRPIFMSTLTSVFGMLPLALFPGAGSELYRGLGSVIIGGLMLSAIITLLIIPPMMAMIVAPLEARRAARSSSQ